MDWTLPLQGSICGFESRPVYQFFGVTVGKRLSSRLVRPITVGSNPTRHPKTLARPMVGKRPPNSPIGGSIPSRVATNKYLGVAQSGQSTRPGTGMPEVRILPPRPKNSRSP